MAKNIEQAKADYNSAVLGATAMLKNALYNRKIVGRLSGRRFHTEGDTFTALKEAYETVKDASTYLGDGERNRS